MKKNIESQYIQFDKIIMGTLPKHKLQENSRKSPLSCNNNAAKLTNNQIISMD